MRIIINPIEEERGNMRRKAGSQREEQRRNQKESQGGRRRENRREHQRESRKESRRGSRRAVFLLACLMVLLISACGKGDGATDPTDPAITEPAGQEEANITGKPSGSSEEGKASGEGKNPEEGKVPEEGEGSKENAQPTNAPSGSSSTLPEISWRLAEPLYEKKDSVVYGYSITDFGIEPNTGEDISGKIQAAVLLLNRAGGGTLYMPAGEYVLEKPVNVYKGVTICGDWKEPVPGEEKAEGTVLKIYAGRGKSSGTAQFILQPNSCVRDLTIWYPEQAVDDIQPYPATFQLYDPSVWGADYTHVRNVTLVNSYVGVVQGPNGSGCPNVHNLYGTVLSLGLSMDGIADVGRCDYIHLSSDYWVKSGFFGNQDEGALKEYLYENATGISLGRVDWSYFAYTWIDGYAVGLKLREGELNEQGNFPNGQVYRHTYTNCGVGIQVDGTSGAGEAFAEVKIENCGIGIRVEDTAKAPKTSLEFYETEISAASYAVYHAGEGDISFLCSQITAGEVYAEKGSLLLADTKTEGVAGSRVIVAKMASVPEIEKAPEASDPIRKVERSVLYVYGEEPSDEKDHTARLQSLLDKAAAEGGGIVFVPGGEYCIRGALAVPEGVELKGAVDVGRNPIRLGTIFRVRGTGYEADGPATVTLSANSGIDGIVFDYPEQDFTNPHPYPYAVRGAGQGIFVVNISLRGAFRGIDLMTNRCDNHYVEYASGICLENAIQVGAGSTGGRIYNYQLNYICITAGDESKFGTWDNSPAGATKDQDQEALAKYLQENLVVLRVGDVKEELLYDNFSYNGLIGVQLVEEEGKAANGWCVGHGVDYSTRAFDIEALEEMGFVNSQLVSFRHTYTEISEVCHIVLRGDTRAQFVNTSCWARPDRANFCVEKGVLDLWNMHVSDIASATSALVENGATFHMTNASYNNNGDITMVSGDTGNIRISGGTYNSKLNDGGQDYLQNVRNRKERIDMPDNSLYGGGGTVVFAEGFTRHPAMADDRRSLMAAGNFDVLQQSSAGSYAGLVEEDGNYYARLYCDDTMVQTYIRSSALALGNGSDYAMELRFRVDSINQNKDYGMMLTMAGSENGKEKGNQILFRLNGDHSFAVQEDMLGMWEEHVWYRVRVDWSLAKGQKAYRVVWMDDVGNAVAESEEVVLRADLQGEGCQMGSLQIAMIGSMAAGSGANDMLLDYVLVYQK